MIFANVTDIAIPQGNVIKIHETNGGRVLWQKKQKELSGHWELLEYDTEGLYNTANIIGHWLDTGDKLILTTEVSDGQKTGYRYYNPIDNTLSSAHLMNYPADYDDTDGYSNFTDWTIDPVTNVWCGVINYYYYCSAFNDDSFRISQTSVSRCCWSEALNRFCLTGMKKSYLMDTEGNIYEKEDSSSPGQVLPSKTSSFVLCAGDGITKFIAYEHTLTGSNSKSDSIVISPDGYKWTYIEKISDDLPDSTSNNDRGIGVTWVPPLNAYIAVVGNSSGYYVFKSVNGINWTKISTIPVSENNFPNASWERRIMGEFSPEKNIVAFIVSNAAYISYDCTNWTEISLLGTGVPTGRFSEIHRKCFIWSKSLNAFLFGTPVGKFRKLIID